MLNILIYTQFMILIATMHSRINYILNLSPTRVFVLDSGLEHESKTLSR